MTQFHENVLRHAQRHLLANREEIAASKVCGCVDCQAMFAPSAVERWVAEYGGETAICPKCGGDCVLGDASGYPAGDSAFMRDMHDTSPAHGYIDPTL